MDKEFNREFEYFLLKQIRREYATYLGIMIAFGFCVLACVIMAFAALIMFGMNWMGNVIKLLLIALVFAGSCYACRNIVRSSKEVANDMKDVLEDPECIIPDDYTEETIEARERVCRNLRSIRGLIISYGIIAITLWAATVLIAALSGIGTPDISPVMLCSSIVTFALAMALSVLAIAYIRDLPAARRYRENIALIKEKKHEE